VEGQLPGQLEVCLSLTSYISFIAHAQVKLWKANYLDNWKCVYPSLLTFHYCACAGEAVEGQLPGQLEVCLSLTSYISFIAHAQVKLWKANYLDNWKCVSTLRCDGQEPMKARYFIS
jgi:hypothetical protein